MEMSQMMSMLKKMSKGNKGSGMTDDVPATIGGTEPAALSEGEYVIPADVVAMLGDGNNEAGANLLDEFIAEVRQMKTKTKEQAPEFAKGGFLKKAAKGKYAKGGKVKNYSNMTEEEYERYAAETMAKNLGEQVRIDLLLRNPALQAKALDPTDMEAFSRLNRNLVPPDFALRLIEEQNHLRNQGPNLKGHIERRKKRK